MIHKLTLSAAIAIGFVSSFALQRQAERWDRRPEPAVAVSERIVSMAPSITETLYAMGLGEHVVGVTRYCIYPADVASKPKIGGYFDPNYEAIVALKPDLIILPEEYEQTRSGFEKLGLQTHFVCHKTIEGIIESYRSIGGVCGRESEGRRMAQECEQRLEAVRTKTNGLPRPKVLLAVDRTPIPGHVADVYVAGADGYFDRMIELAGGANAYREQNVRFPIVSPEGILSMNPDVIVDLASRVAFSGRDAKSVAEDWNELSSVEAVKQHRVCVFSQDYAPVPGPRFIQVVEDLARELHPDVDWGP